MLNEYFHNVCELDLVFNFYKVRALLLLFFAILDLKKKKKSVVMLARIFSHPVVIFRILMTQRWGWVMVTTG